MMSYALHDSELVIQDDLLIYELKALHDVLVDTGFHRLREVNLSRLTEMDFATAQYFFFLQQSCPRLANWQLPEDEKLAETLTLFID